MLHDPDGQLDMKTDLEDIGICLARWGGGPSPPRDTEDSNIHQAEKQTQTDLYPTASGLVCNPAPISAAVCSAARLAALPRGLPPHNHRFNFSNTPSQDIGGIPNGTSPCNHPSLSCQVSTVPLAGSKNCRLMIPAFLRSCWPSQPGSHSPHRTRLILRNWSTALHITWQKVVSTVVSWTYVNWVA